MISELEMARMRLRELDRLRQELSVKEDPEETFRGLRSRLQLALDDARNESRLKLDAESEVKNLIRKLGLASEQKATLERSFAEIQTKVKGPVGGLAVRFQCALALPDHLGTRQSRT